MSSRTRIIVLHKKEVIYTVIFAVFGVALLCLLFLMFSSGQKKEEQQPDTYTAGVYSASVQLGDQILDVEVSVDADHINAIRFTNLNETVSAGYRHCSGPSQHGVARLPQPSDADSLRERKIKHPDRPEGDASRCLSPACSVHRNENEKTDPFNRTLRRLVRAGAKAQYRGPGHLPRETRRRSRRLGRRTGRPDRFRRTL